VIYNHHKVRAACLVPLPNMDSVKENSSFMFHDRLSHSGSLKKSDSVIQYLDCIYRCKPAILIVVCVHLGVV